MYAEMCQPPGRMRLAGFTRKMLQPDMVSKKKEGHLESHIPSSAFFSLLGDQRDRKFKTLLIN